jgi:hypothetical protein
MSGLPGWPAVSVENDLMLDFSQTEPIVRRDFRKERQDFFNALFEEGRL